MDRTADIARLILAHAEDMEIGSPALPIAFAGTAVKPPNKPRYIWVEYFPNATQGPFIGDDSALVYQGILLCRVYWSNGVGLPAPLQAAQDVIKHFPRSQRLYSERVRIDFRPGSAATPIQEAAWLYVPVTIPWRAVVMADKPLPPPAPEPPEFLSVEV